MYGSAGSNNADRAFSSQGSISVNAINVDLRQIGKSSQIEAPKSTEESNLNSVWDPQKKLSTFEAAAAEEELDMLLDSLSETKKIANPSGISSNNAFPVFQQEASMDSIPAFKARPGFIQTSPVIGHLDDALDDLLEETSIVVNQNSLSQSSEESPSSVLFNLLRRMLEPSPRC
ncbi:hypothetical protein SLA2020_403450 [Shorea laevis]